MSDKKHKIQKIYTVLVEEPNGYYFEPEGVLVIDALGQFTLYCSDTRYNFLRTAIYKHRYSDLENTIRHRDHLIKLDDCSDRLIAKFGNSPDRLTEMLDVIYQTSPRQYHFLIKHLAADSHRNPFVP